MPVYRLYFGRTIKNDGFVSDRDWRAFRDDVLTRNLPDGYTILDGDGAWAAPDGRRTVSDPTKILVVALPAGKPGRDAIERIREAYRHRFAQDMVGMIVQPSCASF